MLSQRAQIGPLCPVVTSIDVQYNNLYASFPCKRAMAECKRDSASTAPGSRAQAFRAIVCTIHRQHTMQLHTSQMTDEWTSIKRALIEILRHLAYPEIQALPVLRRRWVLAACIAVASHLENTPGRDSTLKSFLC